MSTPAVAATSAALPAGRYRLDATASEVHIEQKTMWGLVNVKGRFATISGEGEIPAAGGPASGTLTIAAASLDTGHAKRDAHLRSADFFDVENHPELSFQVSGAEAAADGSVLVTGSLTVRGVTEPLQFTAAVSDAGQDSVTLTARTDFDRDRFGLGWSKLGMIKGRTTATVTATFRKQ
jgi:polyisoprenoid-binding protein YceI